MGTRSYLPAAALTALLLAGAGAASAANKYVTTVDDLRNAIQGANAGDRIYVAPGNYDSRLWASGATGLPGNLIHVIAADPSNRPVFRSGGHSAFTINGSSYVVVDGIIGQNAGASTGDGNNIELSLSNHMILKNSLSRDIGTMGNADGTKFASTSEMLMYNCEVTTWGDSGSAADIMNSHNSLFMRNYIHDGDMYNANGFQPKGNDAYEQGFYKNRFVNFGARGQQFGGSSGAAAWEGRDMVTMGSTFEGGEAAVAYVSCTRSEFAYNTIKNPVNWVMRILNENAGTGLLTRDNNFDHNVVQYGPIMSIQNVGSNTLPATFTYDANFWYNSVSPGVPPSLWPGCVRTNDVVSSVSPQLDADYRPHLAAAKQYGAHAPDMEAEFASHQGWFQWAWDRAQEYEPHAAPNGPYYVSPGGSVVLDASASTSGVGSYEQLVIAYDKNNNPHVVPAYPHTITDYLWDLDWDSDFDDAAGATPEVSYDELVGLGLAPGWHTIELKILVDTEYGPMDDWGFAEVLVNALPGDANGDGVVDGADYTIWADSYKQAALPYSQGGWMFGNFTEDLVTDGADYTVWADSFTGGGGSTVPEPATLALLAVGAAALIGRRRAQAAAQ